METRIELIWLELIGGILGWVWILAGVAMLICIVMELAAGWSWWNALWAVGALSMFLLAGCKSHDSDYIPYRLKGMNVYVYNTGTSEEFYAGRVVGSYFSKSETLSNCQSLAYSFAHQHLIKNWDYICCTVTSSSSCATKVR